MQLDELKERYLELHNEQLEALSIASQKSNEKNKIEIEISKNTPYKEGAFVEVKYTDNWTGKEKTVCGYVSNSVCLVHGNKIEIKPILHKAKKDGTMSRNREYFSYSEILSITEKEIK